MLACSQKAGRSLYFIFFFPSGKIFEDVIDPVYFISLLNYNNGGFSL